MNEITQALAYIGAYCLGILTLLGIIAYCLKKDDARRASKKSDEMAMADAVGVVQAAMPGTSILSYEKN